MWRARTRRLAAFGLAVFLLAGCNAPEAFKNIPLTDGTLDLVYNFSGEQFTPTAGEANFHLGTRPPQIPPDWMLQRVARQKALDPNGYNILVFSRGAGKQMRPPQPAPLPAPK